MYHFLDSSTFLFIHSVDMLVIVANKSVPTLIKHNDIENMNRLAIHSAMLNTIIPPPHIHHFYISTDY